MEVSPIGGSGGSGAAGAAQPNNAQNENLRTALSATKQLNNLDIADREFAVVRDRESNRFVILVRDKSTGTVVDQFPPEDVLQLLSQLSPAAGKQPGDASE